MVDDGHAIAQTLRDFHYVRGHHDRAPGASHRTQYVFEQARAFRVKPHGRFVEEIDARFVQQRRAQRDLLLHAVREALEQLAGGGCELEEIQQFSDALALSLRVHSVDIADEVEKLHRRQLTVEVRLVGDVPEHPFRGFRPGHDVKAAEDRSPCGRSQQPGQHSYRSGLAGTVRSEKSENLAGFYTERYLVDRNGCPESFGQRLDLKKRATHYMGIGRTHERPGFQRSWRACRYPPRVRSCRESARSA